MPRRPDLARRSQLARAAFEVLRTRGMQTSMTELAAALGIKRPTLYFYFPDLGAVFQAVLDQMYQALSETVLARVREQPHPIDRLRAVIDGTLDFHRERPQLVTGLLQLLALVGRESSMAVEREPSGPSASRGADGDWHKRTRRGILAAREALIADLRGGIARREVRPCNPERVVDLVLAFLEGTVVHHMLGIAPQDDTSEELARRVLEPLRMQRKRKRMRTVATYAGAQRDPDLRGR